MVNSSRGNQNSKGFTLVEVIVVAVIVAVLALVGIQLYQGYVQQSRQNAAENLAAQATSFLQAAVNATSQETVEAAIGANIDLSGTDDSWRINLAADGAEENIVSFSCPANAIVHVDVETGEVTATIGTAVSTEGRYYYLPRAAGGDGDGGS